MTPPFTLKGFYVLTRSGFEAEAASEAHQLTTQAGLSGTIKTRPHSAYLCFETTTPLPHLLPDTLFLPHWIFARQCVGLIGEWRDLNPADRLTPLLSALGTQPVARIIAETPDSELGKTRSSLANSLANAARTLLKKAGLYQPHHSQGYTLHLLVLAATHLILGLATPGQTSTYPGGIMRLRQAQAAPSRSLLKLEEATLTLLSPAERQQAFRPGLCAVDLGAAPGGWSQWLAQQGLQVTAIDHAQLDPRLLRSGQIEHLRADGFHWRPPHPVHWVCCDMVEQPQRVAALIGQWLQQGWAQAALFNLKLPMKKRYDMVHQCRQLLLSITAGQYDFRARQLYHDREEMTVVLWPRSPRHFLSEKI